MPISDTNELVISKETSKGVTFWIFIKERDPDGVFGTISCLIREQNGCVLTGTGLVKTVGVVNKV